MNHQQLFLTAAATLTMLSGSVLASNTMPLCIASPNELELQDIARTMIQSLTPAEQAKIAAAGGLGSDMIDLSQWDWSDMRKREAEIPSGVTATQWLELSLNDDIRQSLTAQQMGVLEEMARLMDQGQELPFFCFAPDANPQYAYMVNQLLDYQFTSEDGSRFQQGNRWSVTATDGSGLSQGDPTTITYSFVPDGTTIPNSGLGSGSSQLFAWLNGRYGNTATWQALFAQVFDRWAELTGLTYVHELNDDGRRLNGSSGVLGVRGDVRIAAFNFVGDGNGGVLAYNMFPNDGDMVLDAFDTFYNNTSQNSRRLRNVVAHEHGHGIGMAHVCPASGTKLMEPFISTSYDGPQLDDILNGQRHYGDPFEPDNDIATAQDLGSFSDNGFAAVTNVSIDDNSAYDIYKITLTKRAKITFAVGPDAGVYRSGPQTQSCSSGQMVDYNAMLDLKLDLYASTNLIVPVAIEDSTPVGGTETLVYESEDSGVYYAIVSASNNTNNIQRYLMNMFTTPLPPVACPPDINGDGNLDFFDISAFLGAYSNMQPDGDFNNDGVWDFFDVSAFLGAYSAGCP